MAFFTHDAGDFKKAVSVDCKWKDMSEMDALKVLNKLQVKSDLVQ